MPLDRQIAWQERVIRKYPSLENLVANPLAGFGQLPGQVVAALEEAAT
jgi:hypothetical protein